MFSLTFNYPTWFLLLCLFAGVIYAFALYYQDQKLSEFPKVIINILAFFRFILVSLVAFLLLSPLIKTSFKTTEKPIIIIAQDNSESILFNKDSLFYKGEYLKSLQNLSEKLSDHYDVISYSFGDKVSNQNIFSFNEKQTDISALFDELENRYSGRNVGAILLASDGLYNKGFNPEYTSFTLKAPVYAIALGDTTVKKDLVISKVLHNRFAYLGNKFPVQIIVSARQLKGSSTILTVSKKDSVYFKREININNNNFNSNISLLLDAKETGIQRYKIKISTIPGESNNSNNEQDIFVEIRDAREKVLLLANAPHPDIAAIKDAIESNQNYEVETYLADNFNQNLKKYSLAVMHQISPSSKIITDLKNAEIPYWFIGNPAPILSMGVNMPSSGNKTNEVEALLVPSFPLFTISKEFQDFIRNVPAVQCPFGTYKLSTSTNVLLYQKIGVVETQNPLFSFNPNGGQKTALFTGDGLWKWRLRDYAEHSNHNLFNEIVIKTVQYLSTREDKSFFRITHKNDFFENELIEFDAEVYNASYELVNEPDVELMISNSDNKKFPFTFSRTTNSYHLNAGMFSSGQYRFEAKVKVGEKQYVQHGEFSVSPLQVEAINTIADHHLLNNIARKHGGEMIYPNELNKLIPLLEKRNDIKTVSYTENKLSDLINLKWIFFVLLTLLVVEWFVRKQFGAY